MKLSVLLALVAANVVSAHFELVYPYWRANSFIPPASQYIFPCAGLNTTTESSNNRTLWPLDGGSLVIKFHHPWTYVSFNLGLGNDTNTFTTSLNPMLLNETGNGTICLPKFTLPEGLGIQDGQDASLQVITIGDEGTALYNCADITFTSNATLLPDDQCKNSSNVDIYPLVEQFSNGSLAAGEGGSAAATTVTVTASGAAATGSSANGGSGSVRLGAVGQHGVIAAAVATVAGLTFGGLFVAAL
ncbi:hypothetical protein HRR83_005336 [Exophiala dermatitidis]|uniref:Copper acquisition factor BIM1-like domain-containing protein n=2 Tax=Exophiala dermatitidis TaxID=5970 RepID=H6C1G8_EXODN|nr:uncharacterized protein HMPREF1120_05778 [Exophiala dermatitidis NIH/UT8656]XP_009158215.1 hypothetical protein, variant [Exophiala dermatitidis NIH/UT8656]KAJ4512992.1 hypothetical protein HRR75_004759 [Exophiala dermatitidis]EHY57753.1 hypothetical protein, variant [Exophiala dermatitidis NIH/UT8656]EHY57754.1 hypothetical protein HMPREF1120_05778 [Exophiala dermatitidis NIH/UT8656]KAJ4516032.1 hypothetical protein HRR74_005189 [Exophiala dermatitidis]KAJ4518563.1 hypothetical protein HR